ncbi:hypothetical protein SKAU_G00169000 [Synaphobranchus kaupii]|uniref:Kisspeptin n=1 Tax=Synaphobranchus kaupii TaxID=118154 RepID=A0A9Q1J0I5_SYNKA|nr:hypothetical protein SKAU_G00169000 [Synaphobranchus kaupii]
MDCADHRAQHRHIFASPYQQGKKMTDQPWARCTPAPFTRSAMLPLTVILMMTVRFGETYPTRSLRYTPYTADNSAGQRFHAGTVRAAWRVLREMNERATVAPPSTLLPAVLTNPLLRGGLPRRSWWWYPEMPPQQAKKRENFSSYNWNSFGLRYGK